MITFFIKTINDHAYSSIIENLISRSVTFSKNIENGMYNIEIKGYPEDFIIFSSLVDSINNRLGNCVQIFETI